MRTLNNLSYVIKKDAKTWVKLIDERLRNDTMQHINDFTAYSNKTKNYYYYVHNPSQPWHHRTNIIILSIIAEEANQLVRWQCDNTRDASQDKTAAKYLLEYATLIDEACGRVFDREGKLYNIGGIETKYKEKGGRK